MAISQSEAIGELARRNLVDFGCVVNQRYDPQWFHWTIGEYLQEVVHGNIDRLILCVPPRHGKSTLCSRFLPAWYLGTVSNGTERNIIAASYNMRLVRAFGRYARNIANSNLYYEIFGEKLDRNSGTAAADWALTNQNAYAAAGVGGGITGLGADIFLIDDPIKDRKQANSPTYRENLKDWYKEVALTRLTPEGAMIIIMTRWHHDDLVGWLLSEWPEENWTVVKFPALQVEENGRPYDPRKVGEALWPDKFSEEILKRREEEMGPLEFNCVYQQDPKVAEGAVLNITDLIQDFELDKLPEFKRIVSSWDTAFEKTKTADYSVGIIFGETKNGYYVIDVIRGRWRFPELKQKMIATQLRWNADSVLIEAKASGKDLLYELRNETTMPIQPVNPTTDKVSRAAAISGRLEAGRVHIPKRAVWLRHFLTEMEHFPAVDHDDQVDAFAQGIRWMTRYGGAAASN